MFPEYAFSFSQDKCIQCNGCEAACKIWRNVEVGAKWRRVENIWHGEYPKIKCSSASVACMHCADPLCMAVCPEGAIQKSTQDGIVTVDPYKCTGCKLCLYVCPFDIPQFGADQKMQKCDLCIDTVKLENGEKPPCVETCPTSALQIVKMDMMEKIDQEIRFFTISRHTDKP